MKKIFLFTLLFIALFITGCGSDGGSGKKLVCNQKVQTVDVNMIADFNGDELTYLGLKYGMDLSEFTDYQIELIAGQDMCATVKTSMAQYTNAFTNCKQNVENKTLIITADFDLDKLMTGDIKKEAKIEDVKTALEKQNYKCTIN